jgi:phage FluMu gp28-like protein
MTATKAPDILTKPKSRKGRILLPWQEAWRRDDSDLKIWEKSRRIGATYAEANDATMPRLAERRTIDYFFSSADESAAYEFADYCRFWIETAGQVADKFTEQIEDEITGKAATAFVIRFKASDGKGCRIVAMSSNPRRFRSKGGDVGLDEFAYHDQPREMYAAAQPCTMWGGKLRILSTHNGEGSLFNSLVQMGKRHAAGEAKAGDIPFSVHRITIEEAIEQGLVERINVTRGTKFTREDFLERCRSQCLSESHWMQEFMAVPSIDTTAFLPYDLIEGCESELAGRMDQYQGGALYVGMDVGENGDRTRIWVLEPVGDVLWTREIVTFTDEPLRIKEEAFLARLANPKAVRGCVDGTGLGTQIGQNAEATGKGESIKFSLPAKDLLASPIRGLFEDKRIRVPATREIREDLHSIRMTQSTAGHPRFDAERTDSGHADAFWALALAAHAAADLGGQPAISVW